MKTSVTLATLAALTTLIGCTQAPTRIQTGGATALTTMDIDIADFKNAAGQITKGLLVSPAIADFRKANNRNPSIRVGQVTNKSDRNIDLGQITGRINEDLLNSGLVDVIADDASSVQAAAEDAFMNDKSVDRSGAADFYLEGTIMLLQAKDGRMREKNYTFQLRLNDRNRRVKFQRSVDVTKQGSQSGTASW